MYKRYANASTWRLQWGLLLVLLIAATRLFAQSGPYGNEWIADGQPYYKIKVVRDGIYRLDYQYLTKAGVSGVKPEELQLWRRGKEVAIYVGGNQATFDASTFVEFYGQRNDGQLDRGMYLKGTDQPHALYSLFTDTAAYFLTWKAGVAGKRMTEPTGSSTAAHATWKKTRTSLQTANYNPGDVSLFSYAPWAEKGEAFLSNPITSQAPTAKWVVDSIQVQRISGDSVKVTTLLVGNSNTDHTATLDLTDVAGNTLRTIQTVKFSGLNFRLVSFSVATTEISADGKLGVKVTMPDPLTNPSDRFRVAYIRVDYRQKARWRNSKRVFFENDSTLAGPAYYQLDSIPATTVGYDITEPYAVQRVAGEATGTDQRSFLFPAATGVTRKLLIADAAKAILPRSISRVFFKSINAAKANYIVVSHPALMTPVGDVANPVRAYADYRASTVGGSYDTLVVTGPQLIDQYHYGELSPLSIRHFVEWVLTQGEVANRYMLLLGKGRQVDARNVSTNNFVVTTTRAYSDIFFSSDWEKGSYLAKIPTGRYPARTSADILNYLTKVKEHEALGNEPWRKNILHLSGGEQESEFVQFKNYVDEYKAIAEGPLFGGKVVRTITRNTLGNRPVYINIAQELNAGLSLITYFGHGSPTDYDLNVGNPSDPLNNYNNKGKYPIFLVNGCSGGNAFLTTAFTIGENWMLAQNKGAIGYLASSDYGFENQLHYYCTEIYKALFADPAWYGKPIPVIHREVARRLLARYSNDIHAVSMAMNTIWQGDPVLTMYAPEKPDYATDNSRIKLVPGVGQTKVDANSTSFQLQVSASNLGKWTGDDVTVKVTREYSSVRGNETFSKTFTQIGRDTVLTFDFTNSGDVFGSNRFTVELDSDGAVAELNETNNTATLEYSFLKGGITLISPTEFAIVPTATVHLVGQSNDPAGVERAYEFELDTVSTFNSPGIKRETVMARILPDWRPELPAAAGQDSVVYYWRVRFKDPGANETAEWASSSFRSIPGSPTGWSQSHYGQFLRDDITGLTLTPPAAKWAFEKQQVPIALRTSGAYSTTFGIQVGDAPVGSELCNVQIPNFLVSVFNPQTLAPVTDIPGGDYAQCGRESARYYTFATTSSNSMNTAPTQAQFLNFLRNIPEGYIVALISTNRIAFTKFSPELKEAFRRLGSKEIDNLKDNDPFVLLGRQGLASGQAQEALPSSSDPTPRSSQIVSLTSSLQTNGSSGKITSTLIGPSTKWGTLFYTLPVTGTSSAKLNVIGVDAQGNSQVVRENVAPSQVDLSTVSATEYPYLQLQLELKDEANRVAPQLKQWLVTYTGLPEGIVRRDLAAAGSYDNLDKQAEAGLVQIPVVFQNTSLVDFAEKVKAVATITNGNTVRTVELESESALKADASVTYLFKLDVSDLAGATTVKVVVNPQLQPELYYFNNELSVAFNTPDKNLPPTLDVAFDGQHILNGDIVSPSPIITALLHDDDTRRPMEAGSFEVLLTRPDGSTQVVDMTSANITFKADAAKGKAQIDYRPEKLADGKYKLYVQGKDLRDSKAATERYEVSFEVINASTITNIYPFPNPVTSKTRFVFTMTGSEMPRDMKIQIMTLTGKVVREISMAELGPLHIGNNMTEYAWDGTDEFGDRLANGTYLYRVVMDNTGQFEHRRTSADKAFKKDWGKLVLLR
ncbi:C25 family cysteine peptidase [Hymenobacter sp. J193]|uniref:putative type IX secretion system sortase PorU2 n=1 Tax=Hymenobacter sp. J193 TaxID=2898429 RepID=UPI0021518F6C|nr:C25 family cysteine peptidase [Hymenobacter sp. J193]MCR5886716.1 C25 family cysteine peptidase [Hymenobacter sp. J193]